jgi:hypothetical protein
VQSGGLPTHPQPCATKLISLPLAWLIHPPLPQLAHVDHNRTIQSHHPEAGHREARAPLLRLPALHAQRTLHLPLLPKRQFPSAHLHSDLWCLPPLECLDRLARIDRHCVGCPGKRSTESAGSEILNVQQADRDDAGCRDHCSAVPPQRLYITLHTCLLSLTNIQTLCRGEKMQPETCEGPASREMISANCVRDSVPYNTDGQHAMPAKQHVFCD